MRESIARQERFALGATATTLPWEFFWASEINDGAVVYDKSRCIRRFGRPLKSGELGCYTSHFKLWKWLDSSRYDQMIVLEDDVVVDWSVLEILSETSLSNWGVDLLRLFSTHPIKYDVARYKFLSDHSHLLRLKGLCLGTQAYLITKVGARALISKAGTIDAPVDWVMSRYWEFHLSSYCIFPFPAIELLMPSTIDHSGEQHLISPLDKAFHVAQRIRDRVRRLVADTWATDARRFGVANDQVQGAAISKGN